MYSVEGNFQLKIFNSIVLEIRSNKVSIYDHFNMMVIPKLVKN